MDLRPLFSVLASAALFGLSAPLSKSLLRQIDPVLLAGLLYLGAFTGLALFSAARRVLHPAHRPSAPLALRDYPYLAGAVVCGGIIGPISLLLGLARTTGFAASLLLNLEGVMTALIAVLIFREYGGRFLWLALAAMTGAGILLSWDPARGTFAWTGALLIFLAMTAWGADNNLTRAIADKDPLRIARVKGIAAGVFSVSLALALGRPFPGWKAAVLALLLGSLGYGLSLVLYIRGLAGLGASRAGAFFSVAPFIGAAASIPILGEKARGPMLPAILLMAAGAVLIGREKHGHKHRHSPLVHDHPHRHDDGHHLHEHGAPPAEAHSHEHVHAEVEHAHAHWPDIHHRHGH